jgi:hypothetical protein
MRSTSAAVLALLFGLLSCLDVCELDAGSPELCLSKLQLCMHLLDMKRLVGSDDSFGDEGAGSGRGR